MVQTISTLYTLMCEFLIYLWNIIQLLFSIGKLESVIGNDVIQTLGDDEHNQLISNEGLMQQFMNPHTGQHDKKLSHSISIKISSNNQKLSLKQQEWKRYYRRHTITGSCLQSDDEITTRDSLTGLETKITSYCAQQYKKASSKDDLHTLLIHHILNGGNRKAI